MTILIALKDTKEDCIIIGGDRQGTIGDMIIDWGTKIFELPLTIRNNQLDLLRTEDIYIGITGSHYLQQYLEYVFEVPSILENEDFITYYYRAFRPKLNEALTEGNLIGSREGVTYTASDFIIIHDGSIYCVYDDLSIRKEKQYKCIGSGDVIATSVIVNNLNNHKELSGQENVSEALNTTGKLNIYCNTDYDIIKITNNTLVKRRSI